MKKQFLLLSTLTLSLVACGGGSSGSSSNGNTTPPATDTYAGTSIVAPSGSTLQSFGTSGTTAYASTATGVYSVTPNTTQAQSLTSSQGSMTLVSNQAGVIQITGFNSQLYYATAATIYANEQSVLNIPVNQGNLTALSQQSNNGSLAYGTNLGYVGLINNPAGKSINQITGTGGILAIGCIANGSCNSGNQGFMALTANTVGEFLPYFESSNTANLVYPTSFYYYNLGAWVKPTYNSVISASNTVNYYTSSVNPGIQGESAAVASQVTIPEYVTAVTFNGGNIYVGTNLFNIYVSKGYACNNGQFKNGGCPVNFTGPLNTVNGTVKPLGWVQTPVDGNPADGSVGIVNLSVTSAGNLMAVAQESSTYAIGYVSNSQKY